MEIQGGNISGEGSNTQSLEWSGNCMQLFAIEKKGVKDNWKGFENAVPVGHCRELLPTMRGLY